MAKEDGTEVGKVNGEYTAPNAAAAFQHYNDFIAPKKAEISTLTGDCSAPWEHIKKHCHMPRNVMNFLIAVDNIDDDAKQQHVIDALFDGMKHLGFERTRDLVSMAEGGDSQPFVAGLADVDEFEASEEELAQQAGRPKGKAAAKEEAALAH